MFEARSCLLRIRVKAPPLVVCCNKPAMLSFEANPPSTAAACLTESPKAAYLFILLSYYLFIARNPAERVSCEQPRAGGLFSSLNVFPERSVLF